MRICMVPYDLVDPNSKSHSSSFRESRLLPDPPRVPRVLRFRTNENVRDFADLLSHSDGLSASH